MKILHLEDDPRDAELIRDLLEREWPVCDITLVSTRDDFIRALREDGPDLILSDYNLPGFDGLEALEIVRRQAAAVPFIFVSGMIGEERAVEAVRAGAADYVIKDRMQRLGVTIQRVLRESEERVSRRRIEDALAHEQYLLLMLMDNLPDHVFFKDAQSRFISFSRSLARRHGLSPSELKGKTDFDVFTEEHARQAYEDEQRILRTGQPMMNVEEKETWPDGSVSWVSTTKLPMRAANGEIIGTFGISHDITARKLAEERIYEQAAIIDHAPMAVIVSDLAHRVTYCNEAACTLYGRSRAELLGSNGEDILTAETMSQVASIRAAALSAGSWNGELALETHQGKRLQLEVFMSLIRDQAGRPKARLSMAIDITEKKKLEEQFFRAQRLESLGMLAAGIAHDLNNILAPMLMGVPLLRVSATHPADLRMLEAIEVSAVRGAALVRQILSFAHGASGEKVLIQVKHLLRDITAFIEETFPRHIRLQQQVPGDLWSVQANPTQIHQVLLNLCVNARDAMPKTGVLTIRASNQMLAAGDLRDQPGGNPGAYVMLEVADTGTGIRAELMNHIWEPFFSTKEEGKGTGLGLATVRSIAAAHGGFVRVESEPGKGSVFRIFLPAADQVGTASPFGVSAPQFRVRGQGELVLVVDDEAAIRELSTAILSGSGYRVLTAANGVEALQIHTSRETEVALVITDLHMPFMDGIDLAGELAGRVPATRVLYMSGGGAKPDDATDRPLPEEILCKPFTADQLLCRVRDVLQVSPEV